MYAWGSEPFVPIDVVLSGASVTGFMVLEKV